MFNIWGVGNTQIRGHRELHLVRKSDLDASTEHPVGPVVCCNRLFERSVTDMAATISKMHALPARHYSCRNPLAGLANILRLKWRILVDKSVIQNRGYAR